MQSTGLEYPWRADAALPASTSSLDTVLSLGHHPRNAAQGYGEVTIKTQAAAIAKLPRYMVTM